MPQREEEAEIKHDTTIRYTWLRQIKRRIIFILITTACVLGWLDFIVVWPLLLMFLFFFRVFFFFSSSHALTQLLRVAVPRLIGWRRAGKQGEFVGMGTRREEKKTSSSFGVNEQCKWMEITYDRCDKRGWVSLDSSAEASTAFYVLSFISSWLITVGRSLKQVW